MAERKRAGSIPVPSTSDMAKESTMDSVEIVGISFTREEILTKLVGDCASSLGFEEDYIVSRIEGLVNDRIRKSLDAAAQKVCETVMAPALERVVTEKIITETNKYGEKIKKTMTFTEYLVDRVTEFLEEEVDASGRGINTGYHGQLIGKRFDVALRDSIDSFAKAAMRELLEKAQQTLLNDAMGAINALMTDKLQKLQGKKI